MTTVNEFNTKKLHVTELLSAPYATLNSHAVSDEARGLVNGLALLLSEHELKSGARKHERKTTDVKFRRGLSAFLNDLLRAVSKKSKGWIAHSLKPQKFTGERVSHRTFRSLVDALVECGMLQHKPGYQRLTDFGTGTVPFRATAPRFRATSLLLKMCRTYGVQPKEATQHFSEGLPQNPLMLRKKSHRNQYGHKERGRPIRDYKRTSRTKDMEDEIRELNEFLADFELSGGVHRGYVRQFNNGDDPHFDWNKGGRLYSVGEKSYQHLSEQQRLKMTINGEPVSEIDIRASYLTIFLSWHKKQINLERDPYELPGLGHGTRNVVKQWLVATFGSDVHIKKWPVKALEDYRERYHRHLDRKRFPVRLLREKAIVQYPELAGWGQQADDDRGWADLMWTESQIMVATMLYLKRKHQVPSLFMHDGLIVPRSQVTTAMGTLQAVFFGNTKVEPYLTVDPKLH